MTGGYSGLCHWPARQDTARPEVMRIGPPQQIAPNEGGNSYSIGASASADGRVVAVPQGHSTLVLDRDHPDRRVVLGHQDDVRFSAVSPDGRWVVTCSWGSSSNSKTIRVWDSLTGKSVHDLSMKSMTSAKFSPDGRWLMTKTSDSTRLWEVGTWQEVRRFDGGNVAFSPDRRLLAINDTLSVIRLLEITTGREVARLTGPESTWYAPACFTPDGTRLVATCSAETALFVWDLRLIREQLKDLGLDWEWPDFPPADPGSHAIKTQVEVLLGELGNPEQNARRAIEWYRRKVAAESENALACNNLAWAYATAPESLRDVKAALFLAEKAVRLEPKNAVYRNTLGVVYYRAERYREAVEMLHPNLENQEDWALATDLYFLAMSHHRLGETSRAQDYLAWANRWSAAQLELDAEHRQELVQFRTEAEELMGIKKK